MFIRIFVYIGLSWMSLVTTDLLASPHGGKLFEANCSGCHRVGGEGSIGLPLHKKKFRHLDDEYLVKTIRNGRPGRIMPAFTDLSDAQVEAIVAYLREWSGYTPEADDNYIAGGDAEKGRKSFEEHCVVCHGEKGRGIGKGTGQSYSRERDFKVIPPAIGNAGFLSSVSDGVLYSIIYNGVEDTAMSAYGKNQLGKEGVDNVIAYLRSIQASLETETVKPDPSMDRPTFIVDSTHDYETTVKNLKRAISGNNFRAFPDRYIEQGMLPEWEVNKKQLIIRYCNFNELFDMILVDPRLGIGLPCSITVIENEDGKVQMIAMNMRLISKLFNNTQLEEYASSMNEKQLEIMEEATF